jgi:hypothetical protein
MKKANLLMFFAIFFCVAGTAQYRYSARVTAYGGKILPLTKNLDSIAGGVVFGGELSFEWQPTGEQQWQQFWGFPTIGVGLLCLNLGNHQLLGNAFAAYPYVLVPVASGNYVRLNYKVGTGFAFVTKTWNDADTLHGTDVASANAAIGSHISFYLNTSMNLEFLLNNEFSITLDAGYSHISNGSIKSPNAGLNMLYGQVGLKYNFTGCQSCGRLIYNNGYSLPFDFEAKAVLSGGSREIHFDDMKSYPVGSIHGGLTFVLKNWYALGGGFDLFYDGAFINRPNAENQIFRRYKIDENKFSNKVRVGISINNEFIMGRVTGLLDFGVYVFNPLRDAYPEPHKKYGYNRPIFYSYNIDKEDGWNYFRLGIRCRIWDNLFVQAAIKTHLHKAEMLEFGVGYLLPFARPKNNTLVRKISDYYLYHYDAKEATEYPTIWK